MRRNNNNNNIKNLYVTYRSVACVLILLVSLVALLNQQSFNLCLCSCRRFNSSPAHLQIICYKLRYRQLIIYLILFSNDQSDWSQKSQSSHKQMIRLRCNSKMWGSFLVFRQSEPAVWLHHWFFLYEEIQTDVYCWFVWIWEALVQHFLPPEIFYSPKVSCGGFILKKETVRKTKCTEEERKKKKKEKAPRCQALWTE